MEQNEQTLKLSDAYLAKTDFPIVRIKLVCRKLQKGKTSEAITSELEEDALLIDKICTAIEKSDPEAAPEQIYKTFLTME